MSVLRRLLKLSTIGTLVAMITMVAFFAGYGAAHTASAYPIAPAREGDDAQTEETVTSSPVAVSGSDSFEVFWEAWRTLQSSYYGDLPDEQQMTYGAIRGVLELLDDSHTNFLDPDQARQWNASLQGSFEGIGATVDEWHDGGVLIVEPFRGQPAWEAGLRRGDVILAVDGQDVTETPLSEAISLIRGPSGSITRLLVQRPGEDDPFEVEVTRARIDIPVVESRMLEDSSIAYLRLTDFTAGSPTEVETALKRLMAEQPKALILDLRGNPGGLLSAAVDVASFFVEGNILIERTRDGTERNYQATSEPLIDDLPLAVLIDSASASASEIVAGAIQDTGRGLLVGEQSFGKGSVQTPRTLSDGSMLRVTTARWFTPNGRAIHGAGLQPDVVVESSPEDTLNGVDRQLESAIDVLQAGQASEGES